jgi:AcrR family transcriptional regulator
MLSDQDLVARTRGVERDAHAFETLFERYAETIRRHLARIVDNEAAAQDVLQETFLRVWTRAARLQAGFIALRPTWRSTICVRCAGGVNSRWKSRTMRARPKAKTTATFSHPRWRTIPRQSRTQQWSRLNDENKSSGSSPVCRKTSARF